MSEFIPYTIAYVEEVLDRIHAPVATLEGSIEDFVESPAILPPGPRISLGLPPSERVYQGKMYLQGDAGTCLTWAFVNGVTAVDLRPKSHLVAHLLNMSMDPEGLFNGGLNMYALMDVLTKYPQDDFLFVDDFKVEEDDFGLISTHPKGSLFNDAEERSIPGLAEKIEAAIICRNAAIFQHRFDLGEVFLLGVDESIYTGLSGGIHSLVGVGYRTTKASYMDLQLLDSALGSIWCGVEHLSRSILCGVPVIKRVDPGGSLRPQAFSIIPIIEEIEKGRKEFGLDKQ